MNHNFPKLAPSILAADFGRLDQQITQCVNKGVEWIHCDIMDGHFVPNISYGADIVEVANRSEAFLDVHLMIEEPDRYIDQFAVAGADLISVHQEASPHLHRTIQHIKERGIKTGVAVNPATPLQTIYPILNEIDLFLVMSVNPGFGGQSFIESTYDKVEELARYRDQKELNFLIEVDGGVGLDNMQQVVQSGVDVLVSGSSVFKADNIGGRVNEMLEILDS